MSTNARALRRGPLHAAAGVGVVALVWSGHPIAAIVAALVTVVLAWAIGVPLTGSGPEPDRDVAWLVGAPTADADVRLLAGRYLMRVRTHRCLGAGAGAGLAALHSLDVRSRVSVGVGDGSPFQDLLFGALLGVVVGSVLAETWRLRPTGTVRTADITARRVDSAAGRFWRASLAATAATVALATVVRTPPTIAIAAGSVALAVTHRYVVRAITGRGRPALPPELRAADDAVRAYAARRVAAETLAATVLVLAWQVAQVDSVPVVVGAGLALAAVAATVLLLRRSAPWPDARSGPASLAPQAA